MVEARRISVLLANRLVYIAYEVRISCKGPLRAALIAHCKLENQFLCFSNSTRGCLQADDVDQYLVRHSTGVTD